MPGHQRQALRPDQDFWFQMGCNSKCQSHVHAARVVLHRSVHEFVDFGEGHNLVEFGRNLGFTHTHDRAIQKDVLSSGQLRMSLTPNDPPLLLKETGSQDIYSLEWK